MIRLLLVEGEPSVRKGIRMRLAAEPDMTIAGEAADGKAALTLTRKLRPDVVLMDIEAPRLDGIATTKAIHAICSHIAVIMLTIHDDDATRAQAKAAGAAACITKRGQNDKLLVAIRQAAQGRTWQN
jgi:DNA-binding NarL/FixJ family response regulator